MEDNPPTVNKWDGNAVKNCLDDATKSVMMNKISSTECFKLIDGRLLISSLAVGFSLFGLGYDYLNPFPQSRMVLLLCVMCYFFMSGILTWYTSAIEKGIFATVLDVDPSGIDPTNSWSASSAMKKYETTYDLTLSYCHGKDKKTKTATVSMPIEKYFDENGTLCYDRVTRDVMKIYDSIVGKMK